MLRIFSVLHKPVNSVRKHNFHSLIDISSEVKEAMKLKQPMIALESTIITHGMPYPDNVQTAIEVENIVRSQVRHIDYVT